MSDHRIVEDLLLQGASDEEILEAADASGSFSGREEVEELLRLYRRREGWTADAKRNHSALMLLIITRRALSMGEMNAAVSAQKALATLEGLELDPSVTRERTQMEVPLDEVNARIKKLVEENPELVRELGFAKVQ